MLETNTVALPPEIIVLVLSDSSLSSPKASTMKRASKEAWPDILRPWRH